MVKKKISYDAATQKLIKQVKESYLPADFSTKYDLGEMVIRFREAFKIPELRKKVLTQNNESERLKYEKFSAGFCGIASYTWNHLFRMPDKSEIWLLKQYTNNTQIYGLPNHVWLENKYDGSILDLSFDQSIDKERYFVEIPYYLGDYVSSDFNFRRAFVFSKYINVDLEDIVFINMLMNQKH